MRFLSYSTWAINDCSRQEMVSLIYFGNFLRQSSYSCFSSSIFSYFSDLISLWRVFSLFFCYFIMFVFYCRHIFAYLSSSRNRPICYSNSAVLLFIFLVISSSRAKRAFLNLITSSSSSITSPFFNYISDLNSVKNSFPPIDSTLPKEPSLSVDYRIKETSVVRSEVAGVSKGLFLRGVSESARNRSSGIFMNFGILVLCSASLPPSYTQNSDPRDNLRMRVCSSAPVLVRVKRRMTPDSLMGSLGEGSKRWEVFILDLEDCLRRVVNIVYSNNENSLQFIHNRKRQLQRFSMKDIISTSIIKIKENIQTIISLLFIQFLSKSQKNNLLTRSINSPQLKHHHNC